MKKLFEALAFTLALNFIVAVGLLAYLFQSHHLDRERIGKIKLILFPLPEAPPPATQPSGPPQPPPASDRLKDLLARHAVGSSAAQQVEFIQQTFDQTMLQLDRREREVADRERQVAGVNARLAADRKDLEAERQRLSEQEQQADRLAADKGFQDTLNLYNSMTSRQVKTLFMTMDESMAAQYLDSMQPRTAAKIIKEFKSPEDVDRLKRILDKMRHPPGAGPTTGPS